MNANDNPCRARKAPAEELEPQSIFQKMKAEKRIDPNNHLPTSKTAIPYLPKREKGILTLDPDLRAKGEGGKCKNKNLLKLNREKRERTLVHPLNGAEPKFRPKTERMGTDQERAHL